MLAGALCLALGAGTMSARAEDGDGESSQTERRILGCGDKYGHYSECVMGQYHMVHQYTIFWMALGDVSQGPDEPC